MACCVFCQLFQSPAKNPESGSGFIADRSKHCVMNVHWMKFQYLVSFTVKWINYANKSRHRLQKYRSDLDPRIHATGLQIRLKIHIRIMLFYSVAKYYLHALFQQVPTNSLLRIEQICYFQYRYWGTNLLFFIVYRRSSQGTCCNFHLQLLWTSWTDHVRERLFLLYCTPRLEVREFFEIVCVFMSRDTYPDPHGSAGIF